MENKVPNRYTKILEAIFAKHYKKGTTAIEFERSEINQVNGLSDQQAKENTNSQS